MNDYYKNGYNDGLNAAYDKLMLKALELYNSQATPRHRLSNYLHLKDRPSLPSDIKMLVDLATELEKLHS